MPPESIIFHLLYFFCAAGSLFYHPMLGLMGYLATYHVNPAAHWWEISAIRYSFFIYLITLISAGIHWSKLRFQNPLESQEWLMILFTLLIWLSLPLGQGVYDGKEFAVKMTKVTLMLLIATHVVTDLGRFRMLIWIFMITGLFLGYEMYHAPQWMFFEGRFDSGIGGTDFNEGNFLGVHFATLLPFYGITFIRDNWKAKVFAMIGGVLAVNSIVLVRSRGNFLAILLGVVVALIYPGHLKRSHLVLFLMIGFAGIFAITDANFWKRMDTIEAEEEQMDSSAQGRVKAWKASFGMVMEYPFGIGAGNFARYVGNYDPSIPGKDTHNTYFRALGELGFLGMMILILMLINSFLILSHIEKEVALYLPDIENFGWYILTLRTSIVIQFVGSFTLTHTYVEVYFWMLMFPIFLLRAMQNRKADLENPSDVKT